jgi:hypothetical protein
MKQSPSGSVAPRIDTYISEDLATKRFQIHIVALTGGDRTPKLFRSSSANEIMPTFAPDGKWLAYESLYSNKLEHAIPAISFYPHFGTLNQERYIGRISIAVACYVPSTI